MAQNENGGSFFKSLLDPRWLLTAGLACTAAIYGYANHETLRTTRDDQQDSRIVVLETTTAGLSHDIRYLVMRECLKDPNRDINPNCNGTK